MSKESCNKKHGGKFLKYTIDKAWQEFRKAQKVIKIKEHFMII